MGNKRHFDYLIVGAGFSGLVAAERLCHQYGKRCLVVDKRDHIGGNAYDHKDPYGVLIHPYGPHYFRTNSDQVLTYLSQFTKWIPGNYRVHARTRNQFWSFPVNLKTFEQYLGRSASSEEMETWLSEHRIHFDEVLNSEQAVLQRFGPEFFELFFEGYTLKQWQRPARELHPSVCNRIPLRTNRDDRYLSEKHQVLPADGYTRLFENIVDACGERLTLQLKTDYRDVRDHVTYSHMIFTGPIDSYFDHRFGPLPYRSLRFEFEHKTAAELPGDVSQHIPPGFFQPVVQVNYPGKEPWTRIVETKHITGQSISGSTLAREFPEDYGPGKEPYYPIPFQASQALYAKYKTEADKLDQVSFLGRLGTYTYLNMDQVTAMALKAVDRLVQGL
jgi:UDP-galactopyranose mutase